MSRYDSPGFAAPFPGDPNYSQRPGTAGGTAGMVPGSDEGAVIDTVTVSSVYGPSRTETVDVNDTSRDGQYPDRERISGVALGGTGAGEGHVSTPHHPNSMSGGGQ